MDMESVAIFLAVRRAGSISAAAQEHYMTQPALGKRIAQIEKELGVTLFLRGKGRADIELTPEGKAFCDIAERMLLLNEQAMELKDDAGREYLTIASIRSAHDIIVPTLVKELKRAQPNLSITVEEHHTAEIIHLLEKRRVDLGIIQTAAPQGLKSRLLYSEGYRFVVSADSPFAERESIAPDELKAEHCIFQVFDAEFESWFTSHWKPYAVKIRVNTTPTAVRYFSEKEDWMIVPEAVSQSLAAQGFVSVAIAGEEPTHCVHICHNPDNKRAVLGRLAGWL